jgi:bacterioferritin-associated ferredoxin
MILRYIGHPIYINTLASIYRICDMWEVKHSMGYGSCCGGGTGYRSARSFLTKEERIGLLKEYKDDLEKEREGVVERIKELEAS